MKIINKNMLETISTNVKTLVKIKYVSTFTQTYFVSTVMSTKTHTSSQDLAASTKKDYIDFIKVCRSWSTGHTSLCEVSLNKIRVPPDLSSKIHTPSKTRTINSLTYGNDLLEVLSLSKIPSSTLQPSVPPIISTSKEVLAMSDSTNLAKDLLGKFDIEMYFARSFLSQ